MRIFCGGIHCAGCKPYGALIPVGVLILCLTIAHNLPIILRGLITAIEWGCGFLAVGMFLSSLCGAALIRWLMPHTIVSVRGAKYLQLVTAEEARNEYENNHYREEINDGNRTAIPRSGVVQILPRTAYEWQKDGQQQLPKRRDSRQAWKGA